MNRVLSEAIHTIPIRPLDASYCAEPPQDTLDAAKRCVSEPTTLGNFGAICGLVLGGITLCLLVTICGFKPPRVFEPTIAGIAWAIPFLCGYVLGGLGRGSIVGALACAVAFFVATSAFVALSDFGLSDALLLSTAVAAVGFASGRYSGVHWTIPIRWASAAHSNSTEPVHASNPLATFSIWDLGFVSVVVAVAANSLGQVQAPYALAACIFFAAFGGIVCSVLAARLALHDTWTLRHTALLLGLPCAIAFAVFYFRPVPFNVTLAWLISGPVNAIAAQATTVLLCCAAYRWDSGQSAQAGLE